MVRTRFVFMLLLLTFCLIGEYKDQAIVVYTIAFLCTHHSHHVLLPKQLGWQTDWPKESLKDMKTIIFVLYLHTEFIWECSSQIQIMRTCCNFLKQRFLHFYSFGPRKKLSEKWFFKLSRIVHSPPSCTRPNFTRKEWGLQVNYNYFTNHTCLICLRNRDLAGKILTSLQHGITHPWDFYCPNSVN
jgi:hypothetical protein